MSEKVTVATSAGKPTLLLNDGGMATYAIGSGTNSLVFNYKVPGGQGTPDLQVIGIALPSSGAIQDLAGNNASLLGAAADLKLQIGKVATQATKATISSTQTLEFSAPRPRTSRLRRDRRVPCCSIPQRRLPAKSLDLPAVAQGRPLLPTSWI